MPTLPSVCAQGEPLKSSTIDAIYSGASVLPDNNRHAAKDNAYPDLSELAGGIAVITGGASGIGYSLAETAIDHGLHPVIADIDLESITTAERSLQQRAKHAGVEVIGVQVDVSSEQQVEQLAQSISDRFPVKPISLLCCNAGVGAGGNVLTASHLDWDFVLGVNVKGVANCVRVFVPLMMSQQGPGSVVMTSSQDGLCAAQGVYGVTKHACVALSEALYQEVLGRVSVHVLCPNLVATNIFKSEQHRPERFGEASKKVNSNQNLADRLKTWGMPASTCASMVFDAIRSGDFYILAEAENDPGHIRRQAEVRMDAILNGGKPYRPHSELIYRVIGRKYPYRKEAEYD